MRIVIRNGMIINAGYKLDAGKSAAGGDGKGAAGDAGKSVAASTGKSAVAIAGKGAADPSSMRQAIWMAIDIFNARHNYRQMSRNPLRRYERERAGKDLSVKDLIPEGAE